MPNHEMYRQDIYNTGERKVRRIFTHKMKALECLIPGYCPMRTARYLANHAVAAPTSHRCGHGSIPFFRSVTTGDTFRHDRQEA